MTLSSSALRTVFFSALLLTAAGCQGGGLSMPSMDLGSGTHVQTSRSGDGCPAVSRVAELSSLYQFANPAKPSDKTETSEVHITRVNSSCKTVGGNLKLDIAVNFDGALGPKARQSAGDKPSFSYPYFVAVTNAKNQILSKEIFAVNFAYDQKSNLQVQSEQFSQMVPLMGDNPETYRILIGFQLAGEELAYNRSLPPGQLGKSLTVLVVDTPTTDLGK